MISNPQNNIDYIELLEQHNKCTLKTRTLRLLAIEIYKTMNNLNPSYMNEIFYKTNNRSSERFKYNIQTQAFKQVRFGRKSLRVLGPILWNSLPNELKSLTSLNSFKN